jgi:hypothetical protein
MSVSITCRACGKVLTAETEDDLATLGTAHGATHGHDAARLTHEAALARVRHAVLDDAAASRDHPGDGRNAEGR